MQASSRYLKSRATRMVCATALVFCKTAHERAVVLRSAIWYRIALSDYENAKSEVVSAYPIHQEEKVPLRVQAGVALMHVVAIKPGVAFFGIISSVGLVVFWSFILIGRGVIAVMGAI